MQEKNGGQYIHCSSITQEANNLAPWPLKQIVTYYLATTDKCLIKTLWAGIMNPAEQKIKG